jgi:hypothetical protein
MQRSVKIMEFVYQFGMLEQFEEEASIICYRWFAEGSVVATWLE